MKLARIISRTSSFLSQSQSPDLNNIYIFRSKTKLYSTKTLTPKREQQTTTLYRRISPVGNSNESIVPVLDKWIEEGRPVSQNELRTIVRELRRYGRFKHALQVIFFFFNTHLHFLRILVLSAFKFLIEL